MAMNDTLLEVDGLKTWFAQDGKTVRAVDGVSFTINKGETFALLGESGCGKSMTSLSIMRLVPEPVGKIVSGVVKLHGDDLLAFPAPAMRKVRGGKIAMIFQEPMTSLNPVLTIGDQIQESVTLHQALTGSAAKTRVFELLDAVGIPDPAQRYSEYPHQLSGGMKQRIMIAMALAGEPDLLIADEPTTALDVTIQAQVLELLEDIQKKTGMAILLITHDLGIVSEMVDRVAVMYAGQIVEMASRNEFFANPRHPYTKKLFESMPTMGKREQDLAIIKGSVPSLDQTFTGCRFASRCESLIDACTEVIPEWLNNNEHGVRCHLENESYAGKKKLIEQMSQMQVSASDRNIQEVSENKVGADDDERGLLSVKDLKVQFPVYQGIFKKHVGNVNAVDGVSLEIPQGKTLALVGESGCGKTTVAKSIMQLITATAGQVKFKNRDLSELSKPQLKKLRADMQIIFQDPYSSMNPRMKVKNIIAEGMIAQGLYQESAQRQKKIDELLDLVGLSAELQHRYPHEFSGGQRQRLCIARSLAVNPQLIVCDEPTSARDVSVQAQVLNLLKRLQKELGLSYLFITHNISVVEYMAHEVAVMYLGRIVEQGSVEDIILNAKHPYTQALLSAVPEVDKSTQRDIIRLEGELPSPINPPSGCHFHPRCSRATEQCKQSYPEKKSLSDQHWATCHLL